MEKSLSSNQDSRSQAKWKPSAKVPQRVNSGTMWSLELLLQQWGSWTGAWHWLLVFKNDLFLFFCIHASCRLWPYTPVLSLSPLPFLVAPFPLQAILPASPARKDLNHEQVLVQWPLFDCVRDCHGYAISRRDITCSSLCSGTHKLSSTPSVMCPGPWGRHDRDSLTTHGRHLLSELRLWTTLCRKKLL